MFNRDKITKTTYTNPAQILANVEFQESVGCIVPQSLGVTVGSKKIAKAGTPININLKSINTAVTAATTTANAVLLHNVDVTEGNANGTALIFGFINENRIEADVVTKLDALTNSGMITIMKV